MGTRTTYKTDITHPTLETVERRHIYRVVKAKKGNLTRAAQVLGIDRRTLYRKLEKYNSQRRASVATVHNLASSYATELSNT